jgi:hypothetical protein
VGLNVDAPRIVSRPAAHSPPRPFPPTGLATLQRDSFGYFLRETNPANGLVPDNTRPGVPSSIAAVGLGLAAHVVAVERGYLARDEAVRRVLTTLRFFRDSPHGPERDATGHRGFYYHFLDMATGRRAWRCELSTIDSTFLVAGMLAAGAYFDGDSAAEREIRDTAEALYARVDWQWALDGGLAVRMAWSPERGFRAARWTGYNEAILLYVLGLGSPTHPLPPESYAEWTRTYRWKRVYGHEYLYGGPLFIHQLSHVWIDFRGIQDEYMRARGIDYFENSRRATNVQREYATRNPRGFAGYGPDTWGITACDGPGCAIRRVGGRRRRFWAYMGRGAPFGPDDGTIAPWAAIASLPFAPEIVLPAIQHFRDAYPEAEGRYGFKCSFNPTWPGRPGGPGEGGRGGSRCVGGDSSAVGGPSTGGLGWTSEHYYGLDQGPVVLMIENHLNGFFWELMKRCPYIESGLRRAGFRGGWLG